MSKRSRKSRQAHVFGNESKYLKHAERTAQQIHDISAENLAEEYVALAEEYARLLGDAKLVTSVSDRLQNKLNKANEKILHQNERLKQTITLLREARVGRKATTIVLLLAIVLFLISEAFIEPNIEKVINNWYVGLLLKGIIAILLKPIESLVEKYLIRKSIKTELNE